MSDMSDMVIWSEDGLTVWARPDEDGGFMITGQDLGPNPRGGGSMSTPSPSLRATCRLSSLRSAALLARMCSRSWPRTPRRSSVRVS